MLGTGSTSKRSVGGKKDREGGLGYVVAVSSDRMLCTVMYGLDMRVEGDVSALRVSAPSKWTRRRPALAKNKGGVVDFRGEAGTPLCVLWRGI